ncbi:hypothetical protein SESBI_45205 [Sesbania bispinosa]|nr:hypothetical protein SESBI_45205 [Sesbania bispinosa]
MERILRGSPRIFRNSWQSLHRWERNQDFSTLKFTTVPLKVQIWGLPFHCRTQRMGYRIGSCLGEVKDSEIFEVQERESFIKIMVEFDSTKPLLPGHEEDTCVSSPPAEEKEDPEEGNLGPWLRASQVGRRVVGTHKGNATPHGNNRQKEKNSCLRNFWRCSHLYL